MTTDNSDSDSLINEQPSSASNRLADSVREASLSSKENLNSTVQRGSLNILSANYESLDYDICENHLLLDEERKKGYSFEIHKNIARWVIFLFIGSLTALIACVIDILIEELSVIKYGFLAKNVDDYVILGQLYVPYFLWTILNVIPVFIGSVLVAYLEPVAAGSGIPQVKCYLNGVKVPRVVRLKTLIVKSIGVVCSVVGGLAGGKEGPMIHSGAVVAAGISQGKITTFGRDLFAFHYFREDHEKRDFVSGGAAAGVSAAFGAPVGGVLFSLEEGASFWNQGLTWRTLFASVVSTFTLNCVLSAYHNVPGDLSYPGLLNLGRLDGDTARYSLYELPLFVAMGVIGGSLGAAWNHLNYKLSVFRARYIYNRLARVAEACLVAIMSATFGFITTFILAHDCRPLGEDPTRYPVQLYCKDGEYNAVAALWFQTPEATVRSLLHDPLGSYQSVSLFVFCVFYFILAAWTFGLAVSTGLFIPTLLVGAAWGRLVATGFQWLGWFPVEPGKYALIGAAAQLGGVVRMTISLTVIIVETTGNITFGLPLIVTLIAAKWTGDFFNEGIYDIHIRLAGVPLLSWEPPPLAHNIYASEVMSHPVCNVQTVEKVSHIIDILRTTTYNGFPVVDAVQTGQFVGDTNLINNTSNRIRGLILRSQLIVLLQHRLFNETSDQWVNGDRNIFRDEYPRYPTIDQIYISSQEQTYTIDLRPYMNSSPYTILHSTSLPRLFRLFRALGLRHMPVVNDTNEVIGMVTRKDLARYRVWHHKGRMGLEELLISKEF